MDTILRQVKQSFKTSIFSFRSGLTTQASIVQTMELEMILLLEILWNNRGELFVSLNQNNIERRTRFYS